MKVKISITLSSDVLTELAEYVGCLSFGKLTQLDEALRVALDL